MQAASSGFLRRGIPHRVRRAGCGSEIAIATVEGRVTKNGQPLADHWVRFTPVGGGRSGNGRTDSDGHTSWRTPTRKGRPRRPNRVEVGTGGEIDGRGNEISLPVEILSAVVVFRGTST